MWYGAEHIQYYINEACDIRKDDVSQLAFLCNEHSHKKVLKRLSCLYSAIYIDELQDYAGWDLELFNILFTSNIPITFVGDYKQATYRTNNSLKNKQYRDAKILNYFLLKEKNKECVIEYSCETRRFNKLICDYVNTIFNDDNKLVPFTKGLSENKENIGVYIINKRDIETYCEYYHPTILRYNSKTTINIKGCKVYNYGASKGMTLDRTILLPPQTIIPFILKMENISSNQTKSKFYVACTRAKYSIVFAIEHGIPEKHFIKTEMQLGNKTIPCYKFNLFNNI